MNGTALFQENPRSLRQPLLSAGDFEKLLNEYAGIGLKGLLQESHWSRPLSSPKLGCEDSSSCVAGWLATDG